KAGEIADIDWMRDEEGVNLLFVKLPEEAVAAGGEHQESLPVVAIGPRGPTFCRRTRGCHPPRGRPKSAECRGGPGTGPWCRGMDIVELVRLVVIKILGMIDVEAPRRPLLQVALRERLFAVLNHERKAAEGDMVAGMERPFFAGRNDRIVDHRGQIAMQVPNE